MKSKLPDLISRYDHIGLSILPTSIYKMEKLSKLLGVNLYCKRDDLTGFAFGGNKTRKLDYLMKDAIDRGADCIVTYGSNQSNWCRMASAAASYLGLDIYLLLDGPEPEMPSGNLILDNLVDARIEYLDCSDPDEIGSIAKSKVSELKKAGRKPYYLPVGGSGLVCGKLIESWEGDIIGVSVGRERLEQELMVKDLVEETFRMCGLIVDEIQVEKAVLVDEDYFGAGYRQNTDEASEAIKMFARHEGIFLDDVYTGKAASAMIDYARKGKFSENQNVLFIHTGGNVQLFE